MAKGRILIWEAPKLEKPEFRLYYDDKGRVVCYTCEKPEGKYIVIDSHVYAEGRPDLRVINGKISTASKGLNVSKIVPGELGRKCAAEDVSIVVDDTYQGEIKTWKIVTHEL